ncbi:glycosyl hydrolase [Methylobacterium sp. CM6257]
MIDLSRPRHNSQRYEVAIRALAIAFLLFVDVPVSHATEHVAVSTSEFLNSIGVVSTFPDRGQPLDKTIDMVNYCGFRWVRGGIEGLSDDGATTINTFLELHEKTGAVFSWGLASGGTDLGKLLSTGKILAQAGALLAFEGNNEPNNWGVEYQHEKGGGQAPSWRAVANLQRDLYRAVKSDPVLRKYPVWSVSEPGAQRDNVGLQYLKIPIGAGTLMPDGTEYADYANVHNYIYHPHSPRPADNKMWNAADPTSASQVDGLYGNFGATWAKHFPGYSEDQLRNLPRVTTETGATIGWPITEEMHGVNLLNMYLSQFKQGYKYTAVYLLRDREDESGNQAFGFFRPDYSPRKAAVYLHNLTSILGDDRKLDVAGPLDYRIVDQPETVHDLLLQHKNGTFQLIVWSERITGQDIVAIDVNAEGVAADIYDPTVGTRPIRSAKISKRLEVALSDHPLVIVFHSERNGRP